MLTLLLFCFFTLFLCLSLGTCVSSLLKAKFNLFNICLLGFITLNTITTIVSIALPINVHVQHFLLLFACLIAFYYKSTFLQYFIIIKKNKIIVLSSIPFLLFGLVVATNLPLNHDSALYHVQSIKWIQEYNVIPGLANFHYRFGYNPNIFTLFALTSLNDVAHQEIYSLNLFVFSFIVTYFVSLLYKNFILNKGKLKILFILFLFYFILKTHENLSSPSPDYVIFILSIYVILNITTLDFEKKLVFSQYVVLLISIIYLITVKLSIIPFVLFIPILLFYSKDLIGKYKKILIIIFAILLPWLTRNIILTGWLVFPFPHFDIFNFDWKVPIQIVINEKNEITSWARIPGRLDLGAWQLSMLDWFPFWWRNINLIEKIYFLIAAFFPIFTLVLFIKNKPVNYVKYMLVICVVYFSFLFWFLLAPSFRFGLNYIYILILSPFLYFTVNKDFTSKWRNIVYYLFLTFLFLNYSRITFNNYKQLFLNPEFISQKQMKIPPEVHFKTFRLNEIKIFKPTISDRCYDHCLPCSHQYINFDNIELRGKNLQEGFRNISKVKEY